MKLLVTKDYEELCTRAAEIFAAEITRKPDCLLGLATGSTPIGLYRELVRLYRQGLLDFSAVHTVNLDEYVGLDGAHPQSYRYFMDHHLFDQINIDHSQTFVPDGTADPAAACLQYEQQLAALGRVDIQLLGIGRNGHIGFNEPSDSFPVQTHLTDLAPSTIQANARFFDRIDEVPKQAITMGIGTIFRAEQIVLLACGAAKADILYRMMFGPVTPQVPASILQFHRDVIVIADEEAAAVIREKRPQL
jgi:glucosamine-6-phosphate deaminase